MRRIEAIESHYDGFLPIYQWARLRVGGLLCRTEYSSLSGIIVHRLMESIPVRNMRIKSIDGLIRVKLGVEIAFVQSFVYIDLCHTGKIITPEGKAVIIILKIVAVIFPVDIAFV